MIEKIQISDPSIAEEIRQQMAVVTTTRQGLMSPNGFISRPQVNFESNFNDCILPGMHQIADPKIEAINNPGFTYGVLCVFSINTFIIQIASSVTTSSTKIRTRTESPTGWRPWGDI